MPRSLHVIRFFVISLGLHIVLFAALYFFEGPMGGAPKETTPVRIVNLPPQVTKRLPLIHKPIPLPKRSLTRLENDVASVSKAKSPQVSIPASTENGRPDGTGKGHRDTGRKDTGTAEKGKSPLPFLSQADVDELARCRREPQRDRRRARGRQRDRDAHVRQAPPRGEDQLRPHAAGAPDDLGG